MIELVTSYHSFVILATNARILLSRLKYVIDAISVSCRSFYLRCQTTFCTEDA